MAERPDKIETERKFSNGHKEKKQYYDLVEELVEAVNYLLERDKRTHKSQAQKLLDEEEARREQD